MLLNYLKVAIRNSWRNKLISFINIFSLALGIAACLIIYLFIQDERSFDAFHEKKAQIYRLNEVQSFPGTNTQNVALSMPGMGPNVINEYPEILEYTRYWGRGRQLFEHGNKRFIVDKTVYVDSTFLEVFDFKMISGDRKTVLDEPYSIVISEAIKVKFFGDSDPIGESLTFRERPYKITGIIENVPENSHLQFDVLFSITTHTSENPDFNNQFGSNYVVTYLVFDPSADVMALQNKMPEFLLRHITPEEGSTDDVNDYYKLYFQSLPDVHLASMDIEHDYHNYKKFNGTYLDVFALVGLFILLIACFNFMNLITARASHRWKEIGVRKSIGALKSQLFVQFGVESIFLSVLAFALAILMDSIFTPVINTLTARTLSFEYYSTHPEILLGAFGITVLLGFLAGIYPSYFLASYNPARVLQGGDVKNTKSIFRSSLVVIQFGLAMAMIVSTLLVLQQFWFMQNKDIGFNKSQMILVGMNSEANDKFETLKEELARSPHITGVTASGQRLGNNFHQWGFKLRTDSIRGLTPSNVNVDYNFLDVYEIKVKDGRGFSKEYAKDDGYAFIINESFRKELELDDPVGVAAGHAWYPDDTLGEIVGVVEDFNFNSLHYEINTLAMVVHPDWGYDEMSIKVSGKNVQEAIAHAERTWNELVPSWPFDYTFLDEHFEKLYSSDQQMKSVISIMALLAIFIACMGLFGLAAITTERKIKEIGIRKILGASVLEIMIHLSKNFALLILLAFVIFSPFTFIVMRRWLENFAYHIDVNLGVFFIGGVIAFVIALLTLSYHTFKSARSNPIEALRHE